MAPRCPLRREARDTTEPGHDQHLSARRFADERAATGAAEAFDAVGADSEAPARFACTTTPAPPLDPPPRRTP
ncbi:hypothetical protein [Streptomyces sp. NPDC001492]